jgi:hypothetical protein
MTIMKNHIYSYDDTAHEYRIDGIKVPSVTQVLNGVIGYPFQASDFYLERGRAIHACAAMIARGEEFDCDPRIEGQVEAIRRFIADMSPLFSEVETPKYNHLYGFAGTPDAVCAMDGKVVVIDYKSGEAPFLKWQLGAYGILTGVKYGMGVILMDDGKYKLTEMFSTKSYATQFLSLLMAYKIKKEVHGDIK